MHKHVISKQLLRIINFLTHSISKATKIILIFQNKEAETEKEISITYLHNKYLLPEFNQKEPFILV